MVSKEDSHDVAPHVAQARAPGALVFAGSVLVAVPTPVNASCSYVRTSNQTISKSVSTGSLGTYTSKVTYQLRMNTCILGVYDQVKVVTFTNTFKLTGANPNLDPQIDLEAAVLSNYQSLIYPGPTAWYDGQAIYHNGNGTYSRPRSPGVVMTYRTNVAVWEYWETNNGQLIDFFAYQFLRNRLHHWQ
jgi:hypothetical protein